MAGYVRTPKLCNRKWLMKKQLKIGVLCRKDPKIVISEKVSFVNKYTYTLFDKGRAGSVWSFL
jgi:hypothetical protein